MYSFGLGVDSAGSGQSLFSIRFGVEITKDDDHESILREHNKDEKSREVTLTVHQDHRVDNDVDEELHLKGKIAQFRFASAYKQLTI